MKRTLYSITIPVTEVMLRCDQCRIDRTMSQGEMMARTGPYATLDVVLAILSGGCEGQGALCGLRFIGLAGAEHVRSVLNKRGTGFTRRRDPTTPPETLTVLYDGWDIGRVSLIDHGPERDHWGWSTLTFRPRRGMGRDQDAAFAAMKAAMVLDDRGLPTTDTVHRFLRSTRNAVIPGRQGMADEVHREDPGQRGSV